MRNGLKISGAGRKQNESSLFISVAIAMADVSVTLRPPCLSPSEGHKHGVSIQSSLNLGDSLLRITRE